MIKLSQQQMAVLASAAVQPKGFAGCPADMRPSAAAKISARLIEDGLVRELRTKGDAPVWREDDSGKRVSLKLLKAGRALVVATAQQSTMAAPQDTSGREPTGSEQFGLSSATDVLNIACSANKSPTKRALILGLMGPGGGATLNELIAATGWLPHTTRAALTGLRKSGFAVARSRGEEGAIGIPYVLEIAKIFAETALRGA